MSVNVFGSPARRDKNLESGKRNDNSNRLDMSKADQHFFDKMMKWDKKITSTLIDSIKDFVSEMNEEIIYTKVYDIIDAKIINSRIDIKKLINEIITERIDKKNSEISNELNLLKNYLYDLNNRYVALKKDVDDKYNNDDEEVKFSNDLNKRIDALEFDLLNRMMGLEENNWKKEDIKIDAVQKEIAKAKEEYTREMSDKISQTNTNILKLESRILKMIDSSTKNNEMKTFEKSLDELKTVMKTNFAANKNDYMIKLRDSSNELMSKLNVIKHDNLELKNSMKQIDDLKQNLTKLNAKVETYSGGNSLEEKLYNKISEENHVLDSKIISLKNSISEINQILIKLEKKHTILDENTVKSSHMLELEENFVEIKKLVEEIIQCKEETQPLRLELQKTNERIFELKSDYYIDKKDSVSSFNNFKKDYCEFTENTQSKFKDYDLKFEKINS